MRRSIVFVSLLAVAFLACGKYELQPTITGKLEPKETTPADRGLPAVSILTEVKGPESVLYDPREDVYLISNINGGHLTADNNGFISRVNPDTLKVDLKWIESGRNGVRLDAPKGMMVLGDTLYVSDLTSVRKFDRHTGAPQGEIPIPDATFVNDITTDGKSLFVSDTGIRMGPGTRFLNVGTEAIWRITNDQPAKIASGAALNEPNGLDWFDGKLWVVTFGSNEMYSLDGGKKSDVVELPKGELDGLVHLRDGSALIASWQEQAIYRAKGNDFRIILEGIAAPADIGYDSKRNRLLVPRSASNQVTIHAM
jgi:hypothetical protein